MLSVKLKEPCYVHGQVPDLVECAIPNAERMLLETLALPCFFPSFFSARRKIQSRTQLVVLAPSVDRQLSDSVPLQHRAVRSFMDHHGAFPERMSRRGFKLRGQAGLSVRVGIGGRLS